MRRADKMYGTHKSEDISADDGSTQRVCNSCGVAQSFDGYYANGLDEEGNTKYRLECRTCYGIKRRENATKNKHSQFVGNQRARGEVSPELTFQEWKECLLYFGGECAYCGATPRRGQRLTKDHLKAVNNGGGTTQDNIVPACTRCNSSKGATELKAWFMTQSFFSQARLNKIYTWRSILRTLLKED